MILFLLTHCHSCVETELVHEMLGYWKKSVICMFGYISKKILLELIEEAKEKGLDYLQGRNRPSHLCFGDGLQGQPVSDLS